MSDFSVCFVFLPRKRRKFANFVALAHPSSGWVGGRGGEGAGRGRRRRRSLFYVRRLQSNNKITE